MSADEMFKELEYKILQNKETIWFQKKINKTTVKDIIFLLDKKEISIEIAYYSENGTLLKTENTITMQELQAINKKVEELGWIK